LSKYLVPSVGAAKTTADAAVKAKNAVAKENFILKEDDYVRRS
jgi:hypothetical protein